MGPVCVLMLLMSTPLVWADGITELPAEMTIFFEEADEAFFDGRYEESLRLANEAKAWLTDKENKKLLIRWNVDHTLQETMVLGMRAQVLTQLGEASRARTDIHRALSKLESRRSFYIKRNAGNANYWLYGAFLKFIEGDLYRPTSDFLDDNDTSESLAQLGSRLGNPNRLVQYHSQAAAILEKQLGVGLLLQEGQASADPQILLAKRLMLRLLTSLGSAKIYKHGVPSTANLNDAESFLTRAEELLQDNPWWKSFIAPDALIPVPYSIFQEASEAKQLGLAANSKIPRERILIMLKRLWSHALHDWLMIMTARAESLAYNHDSATGNTNPWGTSMAERTYQRALGLVRAHFRPAHPMLNKVETSKARWLVISSDISRAPLRNRRDAMSKISQCRDSIFLLHKIRVALDKDANPRDTCAYSFIELKALANIEKIDAVYAVLEAVQKDEIRARRDHLLASLISAGQQGVNEEQPDEEGEAK
jgi:hypothetical protein